MDSFAGRKSKRFAPRWPSVSSRTFLCFLWAGTPRFTLGMGCLAFPYCFMVGQCLPIGKKAANIAHITRSHARLALQSPHNFAALLATILRAGRMLAERQARATKLNALGGAFMRFQLVFLHNHSPGGVVCHQV